MADQKSITKSAGSATGLEAELVLQCNEMASSLGILQQPPHRNASISALHAIGVIFFFCISKCKFEYAVPIKTKLMKCIFIVLRIQNEFLMVYRRSCVCVLLIFFLLLLTLMSIKSKSFFNTNNAPSFNRNFAYASPAAQKALPCILYLTNSCNGYMVLSAQCLRQLILWVRLIRLRNAHRAGKTLFLSLRKFLEEICI